MHNLWPKLWRFLPVIGPAIVAAIAFPLFRLVNKKPLMAGLVTQPTSIGADLQAAEWQARFFWESTVVLLVAGAIAATLFSLFVVHQFLETPTRHRVFAVMAVLSAGVIVFITRSDVSLAYTREAILEPTIGALARSTGTLFSLQAFEYTRMFTNSLVSVTTLLFSFAMMACTTMASPPPSPAKADVHEIDRHAAQMRALSGLLYLGTFVLIPLVLSVVAWLQWPAALLDSSGEQARVVKISIGLGVLWGTTFTLMLAAAYLPAAMFLQAQGFRLAELFAGCGTPAKQKEWIEDHGLGLSLTAQVSRLAAIAGPLLAGIVPYVQGLAT